jgi:hypothetical protein
MLHKLQIALINNGLRLILKVISWIDIRKPYGRGVAPPRSLGSAANAASLYAISIETIFWLTRRAAQ